MKDVQGRVLQRKASGTVTRDNMRSSIWKGNHPYWKSGGRSTEDDSKSYVEQWSGRSKNEEKVQWVEEMGAFKRIGSCINDKKKKEGKYKKFEYEKFEHFF